MSNFADNLKLALNSCTGVGGKSQTRRLLSALNRPDSVRQRILLRRLERAAVQVVGKPASKIDWSTIDWGKLLLSIVKVLLIILPLILDEETDNA